MQDLKNKVDKVFEDLYKSEGSKTYYMPLEDVEEDIHSFIDQEASRQIIYTHDVCRILKTASIDDFEEAYIEYEGEPFPYLKEIMAFNIAKKSIIKWIKEVRPGLIEKLEALYEEVESKTNEIEQNLIILDQQLEEPNVEDEYELEEERDGYIEDLESLEDIYVFLSEKLTALRTL